MAMVQVRSFREFEATAAVVDMLNELIDLGNTLPIVTKEGWYETHRRALFFKGIQNMVLYLQPHRVKDYDHWFNNQNIRGRVQDLAFAIPQKMIKGMGVENAIRWGEDLVDQVIDFENSN
jgi:hypothetical protein